MDTLIPRAVQGCINTVSAGMRKSGGRRDAQER